MTILESAMLWRVCLFACVAMGTLNLSLLALVPDRPRCDEEVRALEIQNGIGMKLVLIKSGSFSMGYRKGEESVLPERDQRHEVHITNSFFIGKFEVTQESYEKVTGNNPSHFSQGGAGKDDVVGLNTKRFPVERVSWNDAKAFCRKLTDDERRAGRITDKMEYTLPTEAEWEYCCRAGTNTNFCFGETIGPTQVCYSDAGKGEKRTRPVEVGSFPPNAWGLHDMHGNVWEWCDDWYAPDFYSKSPKQDPFCNFGEQRNFRGGCFHDAPSGYGGYLKSASRGAYGPHWCSNSLGFRVVLRIK